MHILKFPTIGKKKWVSGFFLPNSQFNSQHNFLGRTDSGIFPCHISLYFCIIWNIFYLFSLELLKIICCVNQKETARLKDHFPRNQELKKKKRKIDNLLDKFPFPPTSRKNAFTEPSIYFMKCLTKLCWFKRKQKNKNTFHVTLKMISI